MKGKLYVVATPIGNLKDITLRALDILRNVSFIACEDTRNTKKLLSFYGIEGKNLISYHDYNEESRAKHLLKILENHDIALVSDAGTPCISDPGYRIVRLCRKNNIDVVPIPGAFAGATALSASGLATDKFLFVGFLSQKEGKKIKQLKEYLDIGFTFIIYESPNRVLDTLEKILQIDDNADVVVAKELTKIYEKFVCSNIKEAYKFFKENLDLLKGEFIIIVNPSKKEEEIDISDNIIQLLKEGKSSKEIVKIISLLYNLPKNQVYKKVLEITKTV